MVQPCAPLAFRQAKIDQALKIIGIRNFLLGIQDAAFPGLPEEDLGRGSPYSEGAADFLRFARSLGFNGLQLGPQGITTPNNLSPYDGTFFSRNPLSLAALPLTKPEYNLLDPEKLMGFTSQRPPGSSRTHDPFARETIRLLSAEICCRFRGKILKDTSPSATSWHNSYDTYRRKNNGWLYRDGLYESLKQYYGGRSWKQWGTSEEALLAGHLFARTSDPAPSGELESLYRQYGQAIEDYSIIQFLLAVQHRVLRKQCQTLGLKLFGDCQIGLSDRDGWYAQSFVLPDYVMGAPPSRTNPTGQPWNYPVLDPRQYFFLSDSARLYRQPGPVSHFLRARLEKMVEEFDGLRIDHPHGLICPWVYRADQHDPVRAVQEGARLFASPALADHPELARFAIVLRDQLNEQLPRYVDDWVARLEPEQVARYGQLFDVVMATARARSGEPCEIVCEILSTLPYPVKRVMELYGLGRFRVTQKADLENELDVYRSENAQPADWLMLGNHDTAPIWQVADQWLESGTSRRQAEYLASRLRIPATERTGWVERLAVDPGALVQAKFADLFVGPAQNIMVFFTDLLGRKEPYNRPGSINDENWTLRVPANYQDLYRAGLPVNHVLNIPKALAMALRSRGTATCLEYRELIRELETLQ